MTTADASLKIEVVSTGIQEASRALGGLSTSAANAEKRVTKLTSSIDKLMGSMTALAKMQGTATSAAEAHINKIQSGTAAMQAMTSSATATTKTLQQLQSQATKTGNAFGHSHEKANILNNTIKSMMAAASAYISINFAKSIIQQADAWQMQQAKLSNAVGSMERAKGVQQELFDLSQKIRVPLEDSVKLYTRMAVPMQKLGYNTQDTKNMVESLSLALQLNGSTAAEASSVMLQFSQSIAAGRLNGAEFNAVAEGAPQILRAVEDELKRTGQWAGQSGESLKKMASEGKIGIELLKNALDRALPEWRKQFESLPVTVDSAVTMMVNSWKRLVGEASLVSESAKGISTAFQEVSMLFDDLTLTSRLLAEEFKNLSGGSNGLSAAGAVIGTVLETMLVLGANVAFVFKGIGREIAAWTAQGVILFDIFTGKASEAGKKWEQFKAVGNAVTEDAVRARAELDAFEKRVMGMADRVNQRKEALGLNSGLDFSAENARLASSKLNSSDPFVGAKSLSDVRKHTKIREDIIKESNEHILDLEKSFGKAIRDASSEAERKSLTAELAERKMQISKTLAKELESFDKKPKRQKTAAEKAAEEAEEKALKQAQKDAEARSDFRKKDYEAVQDYLEGERSAYNAINKEVREYDAKISDTSKILEAEWETLGLSEEKRETAVEHLKIQLELERKILEVKRLGVSEDEKNSVIANLTEAAARDKANATLKAEIKAQEEIQKEWEKTVDKIDDVFRDGFADMLNDGKSAWKSFTRSLATTFKTMVANEIYKSFARPLVLNLVGGVAGGLGMSGIASAATSMLGGGSSGLASVGGSLLSSAPWMNTGIAGGMAGTLGGFGSGMAAGMGGADAAMLAYAQTVGNVSTAASVGASIGNAIAAIGPWVAALAVAVKLLSSKVVGSGILGSVSGSDFTGRSYQFKKSTLRGSKTVTSALDKQTTDQFGAAVEAMANNFSMLGNVTGVGADVLKNFNYEFRLALADFDEEGKKKEIERFMSSMSDSMAMAFVDTFRTAVDAGVQAASKYWTNTIDGQRNFVTGQIVEQSRPSTMLDPYIDDMIRLFDAFKVSLEGVQGSEGKLTEFTTALFTLGANLAKNSGYIKVFGEAITFSKLEAVAQSGETVVQTFNRLLTVFTATSNIAKMLGQDVNTAFGAVGVNSTEARQRLIDLAGGIDVLTNSATSFVQNFYTEQEQISLIAQDVTSVMKELGYETVTTKDQFKALVKGLNLASKADAELYTKLMQIAPAFAQVADFANKATEEALEATKKRVKDAEDLVAEAYKREKDALEDFIKKFTDFGKSLRKFRDDLLVGGLSNLSPEAKYMELKSRFEKTYSMALAGDETAMGQLEGISQQFLEASQGYFASSMGYTQDFDRVREALNQAANAADAQVGIAQRTLSEMQTIVGLLINIKDGILSLKDATYSLNAVKGNGGPGGGTTSNGVYYDQFGNTAFSQNLPTNQDLVKAWYASNPNATNSPTQDAINYWTQQLSRTDIGQYDVKQAFANSVGAVTGTKPVDIKAFANGGEAEGWSWVGEQGKELAYFGDKAHIYTANQSKQMVSGGSEETDALLREVITELKAQTKQGAAVAGATVERLERVADKLDKNTRKIAATTAD